ncbi:unnamed protein product, partial [Ectocarpus sp. 12 AP-2014]
MARGLVLALALSLAPGFAVAAPIDDLATALRLDDLAMQMQDEGVEDARALMPSNPGTQALDDIARLFDPDVIVDELRQTLASRMTDAQLSEAAAYFDSAAGARLVELELVARDAMTDPAIEEIARANWQARADEDSETVRLVTRFAQVNDLIDRNVASTMTARYQFLRGRVDGAGDRVADADILSDVSA